MGENPGQPGLGDIDRRSPQVSARTHATTQELSPSDEKSPNREWLGLRDWWSAGSRP